MLEIIGLNDSFVWCLLVACLFMLLDFATGIAAAIHAGDYESSKVRDGIMHKAALLVVIIAAFLVEVLMANVPESPFTVPLLVPVSLLIIAMECTSVIENAAKINPKIKDSSIGKLFTIREKNVEK